MNIIKGMLLTSATRQVRQQWFSVGIFPLKLLFGLIPINRDNPPLRVASYVMGNPICFVDRQCGQKIK